MLFIFYSYLTIYYITLVECIIRDYLCNKLCHNYNVCLDVLHICHDYHSIPRPIGEGWELQRTWVNEYIYIDLTELPLVKSTWRSKVESLPHTTAGIGEPLYQISLSMCIALSFILLPFC